MSDALQGINITPNISFLLLFVGFFLWLFVIYWVRHNEPLANQVLGTAKDHASTANDDRQLVAGIKKTLPVRTSHNTGDFFVPQGGPGRGPGGEAGSVAASTVSVPPVPGTTLVPYSTVPSAVMHPNAVFSAGGHLAAPSPIHPVQQLPAGYPARLTGAVPPFANLHPPFTFSPGHSGYHLPTWSGGNSLHGVGFRNPSMAPGLYPVPAQVGRTSPGISYEVGLHTSSGPKVKTIVNR